MIENGLLGVLFPLLLMNASSSEGPVSVRLAQDTGTISRFFFAWLEKFPVFFIVEKFSDLIVYLIQLYNGRWLAHR